MISNFKSFVEAYCLTENTLTMTKLMEMAHLLEEGFEYFLDVDGAVSPVSREEFLRYSMSKTSLSKEDNKRFNIDMNGNEVVGVFRDVENDVEEIDFDVDEVETQTATIGGETIN